MLVQVSSDPIPKEVLAYCRSMSKTDKEFDRERRAYIDFCTRYEKESNQRNRIVMQNMLNFLLFSDRHGMKPSYALTEALDYALGEEAKAFKQMYPLPIHEGIEKILTTSTNTVGRGSTTRWKLHTWPADYSEFTGEGRKPFDEWTAGEILASHVSFGSHRFSIGAATQRILSLLEERYGLDFKELEKQRKAKRKRT
jgi:hypothetical protein